MSSLPTGTVTFLITDVVGVALEVPATFELAFERVAEPAWVLCWRCGS